MASKITYIDLNNDAPRVSWRGVEFITGQPVPVEDEGLIEAARQNPFFEVADAEETPRRASKKTDTDA
ncbi:MAG: hypothetical protein JSS66_18985 [Armatimonadetes bacterium]|nr:hypothetical protein [Armatimonadota bacterium]